MFLGNMWDYSKKIRSGVFSTAYFLRQCNERESTIKIQQINIFAKNTLKVENSGILQEK